MTEDPGQWEAWSQLCNRASVPMGDSLHTKPATLGGDID